MFPIVQSLLSVLVGFALACYGVAHSVTRFPGPGDFAQLGDNLPALGSVFSFVLGVVAALVGVVVLILSVRLLRRRWRQLNLLTSRRGVRPGYGDPHDADFDADGYHWAGARH